LEELPKFQNYFSFPTLLIFFIQVFLESIQLIHPYSIK